jgi:hypothetical protein
MYRIELGSDDIGVFRSIEELATAIKTGVLTPKARIFHSASDKWLPIEFHPHYKKAREMAAGGVPPAPPTPMPPPVRVQLDVPPLRTPLPARSPVAGLPLIDVSVSPSPPPREVAPEPALEPTTFYSAPAASSAVEPDPIAPVYEVPTPPDQDDEPEPELEAEPAVHSHGEPEGPAEEYPAMPLPMVIRQEPVPAHVFAPSYPKFAPPPEPVPGPTPEPAVAYIAPALVLPIPPLPEPEREAIFLAVADERAPSQPSRMNTPSQPTRMDTPSQPIRLETPTGFVVSDPAPEEPRIAEPLPSLQLPRVDLRLGQHRRPQLIAAAAAVLAVSTHYALSSSKPQWEMGVGVPLPSLGPNTLRAERPAMPSPTTATVLPASVPTKGGPSFGGASAFATPRPEGEAPATPKPAPDSALPAAPAIAPPPRIAIAAPKIGVAPSLEGDLKSAAGLAARYDAAHTAARAELDNGLKTAGFANLFATSRLQPGGLRAARASVGTASAYVQRYRRREVEIERAYRDSFDLLSTRNKWSDGQRRTWEARKVRQEHPEVVKLSSFLLQSLDSLYGLLSAQEAAYRLSDGTITFDDAAASRAYGELRPWLDRRAHAWADVDSADPTTAARILQAMGTAKLPEGGSL